MDNWARTHNGHLSDLSALFDKIAEEISFKRLKSNLDQNSSSIYAGESTIRSQETLVGNPCQPWPREHVASTFNTAMNPHENYLRNYMTDSASNDVPGANVSGIFYGNYNNHWAPRQHNNGAAMHAGVPRVECSAFKTYDQIIGESLKITSPGKMSEKIKQTCKKDHSWETASQHPPMGGPTGRCSQSDDMEENACTVSDIEIQDMIEKNRKLCRTQRDQVRCESWFSQYALLKEYMKTHKECPAISNGKLGKWVSTQKTFYKAYNKRLRQISHTVPPAAERIQLLEALDGWAWDSNEPTIERKVDRGVTINLTPLEQKNQNRWMKIYHQLKAFVDEHGRLPMTKGSSLGKWVRTQRVAHQTANNTTIIRRGWPNSLVLERTLLLEQIPGWTWNDSENSANRPDDVTWTERFNKLVDFLNAHDGMYPIAHWKKVSSYENKRLSFWIATQIGEYKRGNLSEERIRYLKSLPGWSFNRKALKRVG